MSEIEQLRNEFKQIQLAYALECQISHFKGGFLGRIAHELRSPLSGLVSLHQLILNDLCENPQEEREFIKAAHSCATDLLLILDEIITISKIDYGHIQPKLEIVSCKEVILELVSLTYRLAENKKISIDLSFSQDDFLVETDQQKILRALLILLETLLEEIPAGILEIVVSNDQASQSVSISFLSPYLRKFLSEPRDLMTNLSNQTLKKIGDLRLSTGARFLMAQSYLESMNCTFGVLDEGLYCLVPLHHPQFDST